LGKHIAVATATLSLDRRGLAVLCAAHIVNDMNQSAIPAILPFLVARDRLPFASAAALILAMNLSSSVVQPLFGHWSDRRSLAWVIPSAVLLACCGTASLGLMHSYSAMFFAAMIAGIGVAAFHPEGSRYAKYCARGEVASGMSIFTLGGYGGFALGPIVVTPLLLLFGLRGTVFLVVPGVVAAILLWSELPRLRLFRARWSARSVAAGVDRWRPFWCLAAVVSLRSTAFFGCVTFLPLFAVHVLHARVSLANGLLTAMLLAGFVGTLAGGRLADRYDRGRIIFISLASISVLAVLIASVGFSRGPLWLTFVLAVAFGVGISLSAGVIVVVGQELLPNRIGMASGVTLGLAVSVGGIGAPLYGLIGDRAGLPMVFAAIGAIALIASAASIALPRLPPSGIETFEESQEAAV
jgi:MFS transporter, FSR family, fosmidomycin resistance protein